MKTMTNETFGMEQFAVMDPEVLSKIDMTEVYKAAGLECLFRNAFCPTILLANHPMPLISCSDTKGHQILTLNIRFYNDERTEKLTDWLDRGKGDELDGACCEEKGNDMSVLYFFIAAVATSLKVRCLLILDRDEVVRGRREAFLRSEQAPNGIVGYIILRSDWIADMMVTFYHVAKEMRHVWQVEKHANKYFRKHKRQIDCKDETEYFLQKVEVDAAAYGYRVVKDTFGWDALETGAVLDNPAFRKAVKKKADKMSLNYSEEMLFMKENTFLGE